MLEFLAAHRTQAPRWLSRITEVDILKGPGRWMDRILEEAIVYPGAGTDGSVIRQMAGVGYAFLFVDFKPLLEPIKAAILSKVKEKSGLSGFQLVGMSEFDLAPVLAQATMQPPVSLEMSRAQTYGFWAVLKRPDRGGRFVFMVLGAEGMTALSSLYPSAPPKGLVVQDHSFEINPWGEWSAPLTRFAQEHWEAPPDWLILGDRATFSHRGGDYEPLGQDHAVESEHGSWRRIERLHPKVGFRRIQGI